MSHSTRVYFHTPTAQAELHGSERAWLERLTNGVTEAAWDFDGMNGLERAVELVSMAPDPDPDDLEDDYLHTLQTRMREAKDQVDRNTTVIREGGRMDYEAGRQFISVLKNCLQGQGIPIEVADARLLTGGIGMNTALFAGSDPVRLAAKIHGWCQQFCWFDGPDRAWLADLIDTGLDAGLYRRGVRREDPSSGEVKWCSQGWEDVQELLRSRDDEPVVLSYRFVTEYMPAWPAGEPARWDALTDEQRAERERLQESWYDLDPAEQWEQGMRWLKALRPWAQITPENLATTTFGPPVTIYHLFAPDRDERIRAAVEDWST